MSKAEAKEEYTIEFSRPIAVEGIIPDKTRTEKIEATPAECAALAARFGIRSIENLKAELEIRRVIGGPTVRVAGRYEADVVQACVVSLQDVHERVESGFETFFSEDAPADDEIDFSVEGAENTPEMIHNGHIDLGEVVAQYLALDLDPYPRAPGVSLAAQLAGSGLGPGQNPFQVLAGLKKDEEK